MRRCRPRVSAQSLAEGLIRPTTIRFYNLREIYLGVKKSGRPYFQAPHIFCLINKIYSVASDKLTKAQVVF